MQLGYRESCGLYFKAALRTRERDPDMVAWPPVDPDQRTQPLERGCWPLAPAGWERGTVLTQAAGGRAGVAPDRAPPRPAACPLICVCPLLTFPVCGPPALCTFVLSARGPVIFLPPRSPFISALSPHGLLL